jgi:hypothetical protein
LSVFVMDSCKLIHAPLDQDKYLALRKLKAIEPVPPKTLVCRAHAP